MLTVRQFSDSSTLPEKEPPATDEIDDKTETENTPKVVETESSSDKCVAENEKEESTESSSDTLRASTPEDTSETEKKTEIPDDKPKTPPVDEPSKSSSSEKEDNLVDVEDSDDYLLHLEAILKTIHTRFYAYYKEHGKVNIILLSRSIWYF